MQDTYVCKEKPLHAVFGILGGGVFLFFGLDLMFFHLIEGAMVGPTHPFTIILTVVSGLLVFGCVKSLFYPKTILRADSQGIKIFSGGSDHVWNEQTNSFDTVRRTNDTKVIPWDDVVDIGESTIIIGRTRVGGAKVALAGGTATFGDGIRFHHAKALRVLCRKKCKLEGYDISGVSKAWNGYTASDIRAMSKEEREELTDDQLNSGFVFHHHYLRGGLPGAIAALSICGAGFLGRHSNQWCPVQTAAD